MSVVREWLMEALLTLGVGSACLIIWLIGAYGCLSVLKGICDLLKSWKGESK